MPLIHSAPNALSYIDAPITTEVLALAGNLIEAEMSSEDQTKLHQSIPERREPKFSDLIEAEHVRLAAGESKQSGIDLSRYEALDAASTGDVAAWKATLQQAYASAEYLRGREINLGLLETYGKNAWLVGNSQLEDILRSLETEVEALKLQQESAERARRAMQENAVGEMRSLEEGWKTGVGRMIETQAAAERLRQEILGRKRMAVS